MAAPRLMRIQIESGPEGSPEFFLMGDEKYDAEDRARLASGDLEYVWLLMKIEYGLPRGEGHNGVTFHLHDTAESLGGIQILTDTEKHRTEARDILREELGNMLDEATTELRTIGVPPAEVERVGKEAIDRFIETGTTATAENRDPWPRRL